MQTPSIGEDRPTVPAERAFGRRRLESESLRQGSLSLQSRTLLQEATKRDRTPCLEGSEMEKEDVGTSGYRGRATPPVWVETLRVGPDRPHTCFQAELFAQIHRLSLKLPLRKFLEWLNEQSGNQETRIVAGNVTPLSLAQLEGGHRKDWSGYRW